MMLLNSRSVLANLHISVWSARKFDRKVSDEVIADKGASAVNAGRFNKHLLAGQDEKLKAVMKVAQDARMYHYERTLPWGNGGARLLPTKKFLEYDAEMLRLNAVFKETVDDFLTAYPAAVLAARTVLGSLYDAADFPDVSELRHKFGIHHTYDPVPAEGDFRVELPDDVREELEEQGATKTRNAYLMALRDAWGRLHKVISHVHEKLDDPEAIFRNSMIDNLKKTAEIVKDLNVMDNPDLRIAAEDAIAELTEWEPDLLRKSPKLRKSTADKAKELLDKVAGCM